MTKPAANLTGLSRTIRNTWSNRVSRASIRGLGLLWIPSLLITAAILLPAAYLVVRVASADTPVWNLIVQPRHLAILTRTITLAAGVTLLSALIAVPLAWLTTRTDLPFRRLWTILSALPLVVPSYVGAYLFVSMLGPRGILQSWLEQLIGLERLPSVYGYPGALLVLTLLTYPYTYLSVRGALQGLDPAQEEVSRSLGHSPFETFWRVTLPQLRPGLVAGSLLVALYVLRDFGAVSIMRYTTFTRAIYVQYRSLFDRSGAAALSLVLIALTILILLFEVRTRQDQDHFYSTSTPSRPPAIVSLGKWRWPALLFCSLIVSLALLIPGGVLAYWLVRGMAAGEQIASQWPALKNSLTAAGLASAVTLLASIPITVLRVRRPGKISTAIERLTYVGFALPGVVIALALVFFGSSYALVLYQTLPMLIFAYLILFLPQAVGALETSLLQVHPHLEEAGRSLGRGPLQVFGRITLPLVRPGLSAGAALVFLTTMKELPATLILGPFGFKTLATSVWSAVSEAFFAQAAAPALLLVLISSVPMAFLTLRKRI
jgi:iron(III) transport system permease protein